MHCLPADILYSVGVELYSLSPATFDTFRFTCRRIRKITSDVPRRISLDVMCFYRNVAREGLIGLIPWCERDFRINVYLGDFAYGCLVDDPGGVSDFVAEHDIDPYTLFKKFVKSGKIAHAQHLVHRYPWFRVPWNWIVNLFDKRQIDAVSFYLQYRMDSEIDMIHMTLRTWNIEIAQLFPRESILLCAHGFSRCRDIAVINYVLSLGWTPDATDTRNAFEYCNWRTAMRLWQIAPCELSLPDTWQEEGGFDREVLQWYTEMKGVLTPEDEFRIALLTDDPVRFQMVISNPAFHEPHRYEPFTTQIAKKIISVNAIRIAKWFVKSELYDESTISSIRFDIPLRAHILAIFGRFDIATSCFLHEECTYSDAVSWGVVFTKYDALRALKMNNLNAFLDINRDLKLQLTPAETTNFPKSVKRFLKERELITTHPIIKPTHLPKNVACRSLRRLRRLVH